MKWLQGLLLISLIGCAVFLAKDFVWKPNNTSDKSTSPSTSAVRKDAKNGGIARKSLQEIDNILSKDLPNGNSALSKPAEAKSDSIAAKQPIRDAAEQSANGRETPRRKSRIKSIDVEDIIGLFPAKVAGMAQVLHGGRDYKNEIDFNLVVTRYYEMAERNDAGVKVTISDLAGPKGENRIKLPSWADAEIFLEGDTCRFQTTTYRSYQAQERSDWEKQVVSIEVLVARRFVVLAQGVNISMDALKTVLDAIDLTGLENLIQ
jgi:hypothetical protein